MRAGHSSGSTPWSDAVSAALAAALASSAIVVWVVAWSGLPVMPGLGLLAALMGAGATLAALRPFGGDRWAVIGWLVVVLGMATWLLTYAAPGWLPPGNLSDLTHHLLLVDVLDRTRTLVPDTVEAAARLGEMAYYTPGFHLLAVLAGAWTGAGSLAVVYPLIVAMTALKAGFVVLVARLVTGTGTATRMSQQVLLPVLTIGFVLSAPVPFTIGSIVRDGFLAQVAAELFAVAGWWALTAWTARQGHVLLALAGLFGAATFLTWPIWIGPLLIAGVVLILTAPAAGSRDRAVGLALLTLPPAVVAAVHLSQHWRALGIAGTGGSVPALAPTFASAITIGLAIVGLITTIRATRTRPAIVLIAAIALQAAALWAAARLSGAETPYMAIKMTYLAIYPIAVLATVAVDQAMRAWPGRARTVLMMSTAVVVALAIRTVYSMSPPPIMVSRDFVRAGQWVRESLPLPCVDYIVRDAETAYWLHLVVLGQPRSSPRTAAIDGYRANLAIGTWIVRDGLPYAIADGDLLPSEVRDTTNVLHREGSVVIIERRQRGDDAACEGQTPP